MACLPYEDPGAGSLVLIGVLLLVLVGLMIVVGKFLNLWIQAYLSQAPVGLMKLIGMTLRKIDPALMVRCYVSCTYAGVKVSIRELETHQLAGGNVRRVTGALIAANRANIPLDFSRAAAVDLAGRDILRAVQESVTPTVIYCPLSEDGTAYYSGQARNGILVRVKARVTVRINILRLVGGATEQTIIARVGQGIVSAVGAAETHMAVLANPGMISTRVLAAGLDAGTAFDILSIDVAELEVGSNVGARLQAEQAEADLQVARARAEERRALAVAVEQEYRAEVMGNRALVVLAGVQERLGLADAWRRGSW